MRSRDAVAFDPSAAARYVDRFLAPLPTPWRLTCLRRAAVLYFLLRRAGILVELCVGVRRGDGQPLRAHAWLLRDGAVFLESGPAAERVADYREIARFPERHAAI